MAFNPVTEEKRLSVKHKNDRRILKIFYDNVIIRMCKAGEVIIHEGDIGDEFYILRSGSVHIYRETLSGDNFSLAENISSRTRHLFNYNKTISQHAASCIFL